MAIYRVLLDRYQSGDDQRIDRVTNDGFLDVGSNTARDCAGLEAWLLEAMPDIIPAIIPAFCQTTEQPRPLTPELVRLLERENIAVRDQSGFRVSAIQVDPGGTQALVFVERYGGDFLSMYYVLLTRTDEVWTIRYQVP